MIIQMQYKIERRINAIYSLIVNCDNVSEKSTRQARVAPISPIFEVEVISWWIVHAELF